MYLLKKIVPNWNEAYIVNFCNGNPKGKKSLSTYVLMLHVLEQPKLSVGPPGMDKWLKRSWKLFHCHLLSCFGIISWAGRGKEKVHIDAMFYSKALSQFSEGSCTLLRALTPSFTLLHLYSGTATRELVSSNSWVFRTQVPCFPSSKLLMLMVLFRTHSQATLSPNGRKSNQTISSISAAPASSSKARLVGNMEIQTEVCSHWANWNIY